MDRQEFINAVRQLESTLYRVAMSILRNESDSADAVQEALLKAYEKSNTLREKKYFKTWITRILIHECYQIQRKKKWFAPFEDYMKQETGREDSSYLDLYEAINRLPGDQRVAITLFYIEGFSVVEISEILKVKEGTVKTRLHRGREKLRKMLGSKEEILC